MKKQQYELCFISGAWSISRLVFALLGSYFSHRGYTVHYMSLRGHDPEDNEAMRSFSIEQYVKNVRSRVDNECLRKVVLIGHSLGALVALLAASGNPKVAGVVSICSAPLPGSRLSLPSIWVMIQHPSYLIAVLREKLFKTSFAATKYLAMKGIPEDEQREMYEGLIPESGRVFRQMAFSVFSRKRPKLRLYGPMCVISKKDDRICPTRFQKRIVDVAGKSGIVITGHVTTPGSHMLPLATAGYQETAECIEDFLKALQR